MSPWIKPTEIKIQVDFLLENSIDYLPVKPFSFRFFANSAQLSFRVTKINTFPAERKQQIVELIKNSVRTNTNTQ